MRCVGGREALCAGLKKQKRGPLPLTLFLKLSVAASRPLGLEEQPSSKCLAAAGRARNLVAQRSRNAQQLAWLLATLYCLFISQARYAARRSAMRRSGYRPAQALPWPPAHWFTAASFLYGVSRLQ